LDALITALQGELDTAGVEVTVSANEDGDGIVLTSAADIELGGTDLAALGLTAGTTEAVAAEGEEGAVTGIDVSTHKKASAAIDTIDSAIKLVSAQRSKLGAWQNRLEHTIKNLDTSSENLQAAESRIRDVDMAKEMMEQTKQNILQQASTAMLAQANVAPQSVLQLLQ
jgi:flagellin